MTEKERTIAYLKHGEYDAAPLRHDVIGISAAPEFKYHIDLPFCERPMDKSGYDVFGVHWTAAVEGCHWTPSQDTVLKDITNWKNEVRFPNVDKFDWDYVAQQAKKVDRESTIITTTLIMGAFERFTSLCTFQDCLMSFALEPEACGELIGAIVDYKISIIDRLAEVFCPDALLVHDDWGTTKAPFLSPATWRETLRPHTQRLYDAAKKHGMVIAQHSCGNITPIVGDLVEMGLDLWEGQEYCNDAAMLREKYGDKLHLELYPLLTSEDMAKLNIKMDTSSIRSAQPYAERPEFLY